MKRYSYHLRLLALAWAGVLLGRRHSMWRRRRSERNAGAARHAACTHRRQVLLMEQYVGRRHLRRRCSHRSLRRRGCIHGRCTALHQQCASHVEGGPVPKRSLTHAQTFGRYAGSLYPSCRPDAPRRHDGDPSRLRPTNRPQQTSPLPISWPRRHSFQPTSREPCR